MRLRGTSVSDDDLEEGIDRVKERVEFKVGIEIDDDDVEDDEDE